MINPYFAEDLYFSSFDANGKTFTFLLNSRKDHIQKFLATGDFYEREELELLCGFCDGRKRLLDIGANIGNHSIFLAHRLSLARVTPIEPQPAILHILKANLGLNWHPSFDLSHLGIGLSDEAGWARIGAFNEANIGGTSMIPAMANNQVADRDAYPVRVYAGDDLFQRGDFDIFKIDVEGMEIEVLRGLGRCLEGVNAVIFIEVQNENVTELAGLIDAMGFRKIDEHRRYAKCSNWVLTR